MEIKEILQYLSSGATFTIDNDAVTYAKIQNVSATDRLLGRDSSGAGIIEEIAPSAVRTMLGLAKLQRQQTLQMLLTFLLERLQQLD